MAKNKTVSFDLNQLPSCCGFYEAGDFQNEEAEGWTDCVNVEADTYVEAWTQAIVKMRVLATEGHHLGTRPIILNFVKYKGEKRWQAEILRRLVKAEPDVKRIGKWVNCNTGNIIESYVLMNGAK